MRSVVQTAHNSLTVILLYSFITAGRDYLHCQSDFSATIGLYSDTEMSGTGERKQMEKMIFCDCMSYKILGFAELLGKRNIESLIKRRSPIL
jgi:hypothetical protein